jgi:hypothetical protein
MKVSQIAPVFFLLLLVGFQMQANAQGLAGVSCTIVVSEDTMTDADIDYYGFDYDDFENDNYAEASSSASVSILTGDGFDFDGFEADMNPADYSSIIGMLDTRFAESTTNLQSDSYSEGDGQYMVVIEYN